MAEAHRTIVAVDIERFSDPSRNSVALTRRRAGMYDVLDRAFTDAEIEFDQCTVEDRGDGALILVPPRFSRVRLVNSLPDRLTDALRRYNSTAPEESGLRLRVALHVGEVRQDDFGVVGLAVVDASRLVSSPQLKQEVRSAGEPIGLIVSDLFYRSVIANAPETDPDSYRMVHVRAKETDLTAWLRRPSSRLRAREIARSIAARSNTLPVAIYVSDSTVFREVETAVETLLAAAGLESDGDGHD